MPRDPGKVGIYACGLTPQGPAHLGHMRGAVAFDAIRRWLIHIGYEVRMVQNFTDIDDKIIRKSARGEPTPGPSRCEICGCLPRRLEQPRYSAGAVCSCHGKHGCHC